MKIPQSSHELDTDKEKFNQLILYLFKYLKNLKNKKTI